MRTPLLRAGHGRCSILHSFISSDLFRQTNFRLDHRPFDFFLPKPSLSTTSSAHRIRLLSTGSARNRSVTVGGKEEVWGAEVVWVWVAVEFEGAVERRRFWVEMEGMFRALRKSKERTCRIKEQLLGLDEFNIERCLV